MLGFRRFDNSDQRVLMLCIINSILLVGLVFVVTQANANIIFNNLSYVQMNGDSYKTVTMQQLNVKHFKNKLNNFIEIISPLNTKVTSGWGSLALNNAAFSKPGNLRIVWGKTATYNNDLFSGDKLSFSAHDLYKAYNTYSFKFKPKQITIGNVPDYKVVMLIIKTPNPQHHIQLDVNGLPDKSLHAMVHVKSEHESWSSDHFVCNASYSFPLNYGD